MKTAVLSLVVLVLFSCQFARAGAIGALGSSLSFEHDADGRSYDVQSPFSVRAGYRFKLADFYLEYSHFQRSTDVSIVDVERQHTEWIVWTRHFFLERYWIQPYAAFGAGFQYDTINTSFAGEGARDQGVPDSLAAFAGGLRVLMAKRFSLELEAKAGFSRTYSPNPLLAVGVFAGLNF